MNTYKLIPTTRSIEKRWLVKEILKAIPMLVSILIVIHLMKTPVPKDSLLSGLLFAAVLIASRSIGLYDHAKAERKKAAGYKLTIDEDSIICETSTDGIVRINYTDVKSAKEYSSSKQMIIKGARWKDQIVIPARIENYDQIRQSLSQHLDIKNTTSIAYLLLNDLSLVAVCMSLLLFRLLTVDNVDMTWLASIALGCMLVWGGLAIATSPQKNRGKLFCYIALLIYAALIAILLLRHP